MKGHSLWMLTNVSNGITPIVTNYSRYTIPMDITDLNYQIFLLNIPGIILVGILAIFGAIGNALVLYVYIWKIRPSNHRIFIIFLAVIDLTVSVIGMPSIIYEQIYPLMQYDKWVCKMRYSILYLMLNASILILLVIAGERYRKVCKPLRRQMSLTQAKVACVGVVVISVCLTLPETVMFGLYKIQTEIPGLTGSSCYIGEAYLSTSFSIVQSAFSISFIYIAFVLLLVLYYYVILKIRRQTKMDISAGKSSKSMISTSSSIASNDDYVRQGSADDTSGIPLSTPSNDDSPAKRRKMETYVKKTHGNIETTRPSSRRTTLILFTITIVFLISYSPFIILELLDIFLSDFEDSLESIEYCIFNFFQWSFFINNMANPIIYGFYDERFIKQMKICCACVLIKHA